MRAAEARRIVEELGIRDHVISLVDDAPPLPSAARELVGRLRRQTVENYLAEQAEIESESVTS